MTPIHLTFLFAAAPAILYSDYQGLRWVLGGSPLNQKHLTFLHYWIYVCLIGIVTTGGLMFLQGASYYLSLAPFLVKMVFVAALIVNSFLIGAHMRLTTKRFSELTAAQQRGLFISGAVSGTCWLGAIVCGLLIG